MCRCILFNTHTHFYSYLQQQFQRRKLGFYATSILMKKIMSHAPVLGCLLQIQMFFNVTQIDKMSICWINHLLKHSQKIKEKKLYRVILKAFIINTLWLWHKRSNRRDSYKCLCKCCTSLSNIFLLFFFWIRKEGVSPLFI